MPPSGYTSSTAAAPGFDTRPETVTGESSVTGSVKGTVTDIPSAPVPASVEQTAPRGRVPLVTSSAQ